MLTSLPDELITLVAEKLDLDCLGNFAATSAACKSAAQDSVSMVTLTKEQCQEEADARGFILFRTAPERFEKADVPGCLILERNGKVVGMRYNPISMSTIRETWDVKEPVYSWVTGTGTAQDTYAYEQICYKTSRLSAADANYYSPYKLKTRWVADGDPLVNDLQPVGAQYNIACNPGMMAELFRSSLTTSPCAEKLSFKSQAKYRRASDAIAAGDMAYAQALMEKNVLFDRLTNKWCPEIWADVQKGSVGRKCPVDHPNMINRMAAVDRSAWRRNPERKMSMVDESCTGISDETLASITDTMDASKPTTWELNYPILPHRQNAVRWQDLQF